MNNLEAFRDIRTFIFDVDGVFTNGSLILTEEGEQLRQMNIKDGFAVKCALNEGYRIAIISGGKSAGVMKRLHGLGIIDVMEGIEDKIAAYDSFVRQYELDEASILYMGDDIPDYPVMRRVGLPCCPKDAVPEILQVSRYVSPFPGGGGCVRDVIERVMRVHGSWFSPTPG